MSVYPSLVPPHKRGVIYLINEWTIGQQCPFHLLCIELCLPRRYVGTSLVVQWLRFWASSSRGSGLIPDWGTMAKTKKKKKPKRVCWHPKPWYLWMWPCFLFIFNWKIIALQFVLVSEIQHESAIGMCMSLPSWTSLPPPTLSYASQLSQSTGLSSLCYIAALCFTYDRVYVSH